MRRDLDPDFVTQHSVALGEHYGLADMAGSQYSEAVTVLETMAAAGWTLVSVDHGIGYFRRTNGPAARTYREQIDMNDPLVSVREFLLAVLHL